MIPELAVTGELQKAANLGQVDTYHSISHRHVNVRSTRRALRRDRVGWVVNGNRAAYTAQVTSATKKILEDALTLPENEREALVEALSDSLDPEAIELGPEWTSEIRNRIAQIESGEAKTIPWDEVDARIRKSLAHK